MYILTYGLDALNWQLHISTGLYGRSYGIEVGPDPC